MSFLKWLIENKETNLYHGTNNKLPNDKMDITRMFHKNGNFETGIGISFSTSINVAKSYGKHIYKYNGSAQKLIPKLIPSRAQISSINKTNMIKFVSELCKVIPDRMTHLFSDYGIEIEDKITKIHIEKYYSMAKTNEVRNFQIEILQYIGINYLDKFITLWLSILKIPGQSNKQSQFFAIMDDIELEYLGDWKLGEI